MSSDGMPVARASTMEKKPPSGCSTRARGRPASASATTPRRRAYSPRISSTHACGPVSATAAASWMNVAGPRLDCCSTRNIAEMIGSGAAQ